MVLLLGEGSYGASQGIGRRLLVYEDLLGTSDRRLYGLRKDISEWRGFQRGQT